MRRRFVLAMASDPKGSARDWAIAAGYSDVKEGAKVRAHECLHDEKVQAAIGEVAKATLGTVGPLLAVHAVLSMARDRESSGHVKAVEMILNRTGMGEKQQIEITHRDLTGDALMERLRFLAEKHGVNLGNLNTTEPKVIEHEKAE